VSRRHFTTEAVAARRLQSSSPARHRQLDGLWSTAHSQSEAVTDLLVDAKRTGSDESKVDRERWWKRGKEYSMSRTIAATAMAVEKTQIEEEAPNATLPDGPRESQIAIAAYYLWVDRGCPVGSDQDDWFRAEAELRNGQKSD